MFAVNFLVIVGVLPTLIDFVVYVIEPHYLMSDVYRSVLNKNLLLLLVRYVANERCFSRLLLKYFPDRFK